MTRTFHGPTRSPIDTGSRWRHWRCTDTDRWDVVVLAVVENDGAPWVVYGEAVRTESPFPAEPSVMELGDFVAAFSEVGS